MKKYISLIVLGLLLSAILVMANDKKPVKEVELRHYILPTDSGTQYLDTSIVIEVFSDNSLIVNGVLFSNLIREVIPAPEDDMIYDVYSSKDDLFHVCLDLNPDNGEIMQVIMYHMGGYYCFR